MFSAMMSRNFCCVAMPSELIARDRMNWRTGRGVIGKSGILATARSDRGAEALIGGAEELSIGFESEIGIGERGHVALEVLFGLPRFRQLGVHGAGERGARAALDRSRYPLAD